MSAQTPSTAALEQIRKLSEVVYGEPGLAFKHHGMPQTRVEASQLLKQLHAYRRGHNDIPEPSASTTEEPMPDKKLKYCPDCDAAKPVAEFGKNRSSKDGLSSYCKQHMRERSRKSAAKKRKKQTRKDPVSAENKKKVEASVASKPKPEPDPPQSQETNGDFLALFADPRLSDLERLQSVLSETIDTSIELTQTISVARELVAAFGPKGADE